ncbi:hypothetical protein SAFG77S_04894 [Streptomyces afghaniensis]
MSRRGQDPGAICRVRVSAGDLTQAQVSKSTVSASETGNDWQVRT